MKYKHSISVAGENLSLCSGDNPAYVERLAGELTKRIHTLMLSGADVDVTKAAIVCALDLLDENVKLKFLLKEKTNADK